MFGYSTWDRKDQKRWNRNITIGAIIAACVIAFPASAYRMLTIANPTVDGATINVQNNADIWTIDHRKLPSVGTIKNESVSYKDNALTVSGTLVDNNGTPIKEERIVYEFYDNNGNAWGCAETETKQDGSYLVSAKDAHNATQPTLGFACLNAAGGAYGNASTLLVGKARTSSQDDEKSNNANITTHDAQREGKEYHWGAATINSPFETNETGKLGRYQDNWYIANPHVGAYQELLSSLKRNDIVYIDDKKIFIDDRQFFPISTSYATIQQSLPDNRVCFAHYIDDKTIEVAYGKAQEANS